MSVNIQTLKDILNYLTYELRGIYPPEEITAICNLIIKTQFGFTRLQMLLEKDKPVSRSGIDKIISICNELKTGKPVQYILGETLFLDCIIKLNGETLIPRPETEELVNIIISENKDFTGRIIDFGTGSGCIAIAIKKHIPNATVAAIDISGSALEIASENAILNNVDIDFIGGDILNPDLSTIGRAEIVVSNPPYILDSEKSLMSGNVIDFEPHKALFVSDQRPLVFYEAIAGLSQKILLPGGRLYFEINEKKGQDISRLLEAYGYTGVKIIDDINGKNRFVKAISNG
jgi:release factor glutamine methyltransferase